MNLEESDSYKDQIEKNTRNRRSVMLSIVLCAFLMAFLFIIIMILKYQDSITEKLFLDGKQIAIPQDFYRDIDGETYINLRNMASILGYNYTKGVYGEYNENEDSAYMQNDFEILAVTAENESYSKYVEVIGKDLMISEIPVTLKSENGYSEIFKIEKTVKFVDGNLYAPLEYVPEMFNVQIDWQEFRKRVYSLENIMTEAKKRIVKMGYGEISGYYENLRAILYGYAIVGNGNTENPSTAYGVISLSDGKEIISIKYDDIKFIQNVKEFYITAANGTVGILGSDGSTIINPSEFEEISLMDEEKELYLVKKGEEYGVLNRNGKVIIYAENDEIGYDTSKFDSDLIDNSYILYGKVIPVEKSGKYGLYNLDGELKLKLNYDGLGYISTESKSSGNEESTLLIPPSVGICGVVVNWNDLYGIFDVNTEELVLPCSYSKIYSITRSGKTTYYVEFNGERMELEQLLVDAKLNNVDETGRLLSERRNNSAEQNSSTNTTVTNTNTVDDTKNTVELN